MSDRTVDVTSSSQSTRQLTRYYLDGRVAHAWAPVTTEAGRHSRKRVPSGGKPSTYEDEKPFLHTSVKVNWPSGRVQYTEKSGSVYYISTGTGSSVFGTRDRDLALDLAYPPTFGPDAVRYTPSSGAGTNPDLLSQAEVKALNKLRDKSGQPDLDYGLWFGERRETAALFARGAVGILNLARSIAQKDYRQSAQVLRDVFGVSASAKAERARMRRLERWLRREARNGRRVANRTLKGLEDAALTYNLGISPLLNDLQQVHQLLLTGDLTSKMAVKAVARHSITENDSRTLMHDRGLITNVTTFAQTHGYTVTFVALPIHSERARISRMGLANPMNTAYQLTGLTFLLDYFVALGPWLESLNVPMEFEFKAGSYTHRIVRNVTQTVRSPGGKVAKGMYTLNHTQRKLYTKFPVPIPPLSLRGKDLSVKQSVNAGLIALKGLRTLIGPIPYL